MGRAMGLITMSEREFSRLDILLDLDGDLITATDACRLMALGRSQVFRLLRKLRRDDSASLVSKRRGRRSSNRLPVAIRDLAMAIVKERYADFGPTLACEKLAEPHGCTVSREALRKWIIEDGLWADPSRRLPRVHPPRNRLERVGKLIQIDDTKNFWFKIRGNECTLIA